MKARFLALLMILIISAPICNAETLTKISIHEAIDIALKNSMDLQSEKINTQIAKNSIKAANRLQNPSIDTFFNFKDAGFGNPNQAGIIQTIELFKRHQRKKLAQTNYEIAKENTQYANYTLKMNVKEAYVNLVAAKSIVEALEGERKLLEEIDAIAKKRLRENSGSQNDVIQADIALNQIITQINTVNADLLSARFALNSTMDTDPVYDTMIENFNDDELFFELMTPHPKDELPDFNEITVLAENTRFDLKIAKTQIDSAKKQYEITSFKRIPDLEIQGGYAYQSKSMSESGKFKNGAYVGASLVNLPILYTYAPEIQNAKLEIEKAELKYCAVKNNAFANLSSAYERFVHARLNLNYYNDSLIQNSKDMMITSKKNYEEGRTDLTSLIVIENSYRSIIIGYTFALARYYNSWIDFLREIDTENLNDVENI